MSRRLALPSAEGTGVGVEQHIETWVISRLGVLNSKLLIATQRTLQLASADNFRVMNYNFKIHHVLELNFTLRPGV